MKILILQGPNLNLLGLKSSQIKEQLTLDKLNKKLKNEIKNKRIQLNFCKHTKLFKQLIFYKEIEIKHQDYFSFQHRGQELIIQF